MYKVINKYAFGPAHPDLPVLPELLEKFPIGWEVWGRNMWKSIMVNHYMVFIYHPYGTTRGLYHVHVACIGDPDSTTACSVNPEYIEKFLTITFTALRMGINPWSENNGR